MIKAYSVTIRAVTTVIGRTFVKANSQEEAEKIGLKMAREGEVSFGDPQGADLHRFKVINVEGAEYADLEAIVTKRGRS